MDFFMLSHTVLFRGLTIDEIKSVLPCLGAKERQYVKGESVWHTGSTVTSFGLVLSGGVLIENDDIWGNKTVLNKIGTGKVFGETYAFASGEALMVNVVAAEECRILFLQVKPLLTVCKKMCGYHNKIIENLIFIFAQKNLHLSRRMFHISSKSIRGRLRSYLSYQATKAGAWEIELPFNRQQLADYLGVDRSALSNEISKMQKEGLIKAEKNRFHIIRTKHFEM
ncbi:Crp/Fnr family transcriptional regulator [Treponema pedis]|uniref:Crp/Fnr family transcriptional regulator n=1 Tax=Treponema pedis TaxID=409322 RepID=UPI000413588E|nr:Crp/Fnr family transcriptional regulator [Treponema pedis]QSI03633.1 Crp/Fnr family transcriptional regulator [Treponema pedis]